MAISLLKANNRFDPIEVAKSAIQHFPTDTTVTVNREPANILLITVKYRGNEVYGKVDDNILTYSKDKLDRFMAIVAMEIGANLYTLEAA